MIFVDTSVWIHFFNGVHNPYTQTLNVVLGERRVVSGDLVLTELLQGFRNDEEFRTVRAYMQLFPCEPMVGQQAAVEAAQAFRTLRRRGLTIRKTIDVLIAMHCIRNDYSLLHQDRDFSLMAPALGLRELHVPNDRQ